MKRSRTSVMGLLFLLLGCGQSPVEEPPPTIYFTSPPVQQSCSSLWSSNVAPLLEKASACQSDSDCTTNGTPGGCGLSYYDKTANPAAIQSALNTYANSCGTPIWNCPEIPSNPGPVQVHCFSNTCEYSN